MTIEQAKVDAIRRLRDRGLSLSAIAEELGVSKGTVHRVASGLRVDRPTTAPLRNLQDVIARAKAARQNAMELATGPPEPVSSDLSLDLKPQHHRRYLQIRRADDENG